MVIDRGPEQDERGGFSVFVCMRSLCINRGGQRFLHGAVLFIALFPLAPLYAGPRSGILGEHSLGWSELRRGSYAHYCYVCRLCGLLGGIT